MGKALKAVGLIAWVIVGVYIGQTIGAQVVLSAPHFGNVAVQTSILAALGYIFAILIVVGIPLILRRQKINYDLLGIQRLPLWSDIGIGVLAILPYFILASVVVWLGTDILRIIDPTVGQEIGFKNLYLRIEYIVAFLTLVVMAPIAEELLFRGYFQGKLTAGLGRVLAVIVSAVVFGSLHLLALTDNGIVYQWGAAADTFALGLVLGVLRLLTGSIWAGVILHALKNGIAYYFLFIAVAR